MVYRKAHGKNKVPESQEERLRVIEERLRVIDEHFLQLEWHANEDQDDTYHFPAQAGAVQVGNYEMYGENYPHYERAIPKRPAGRSPAIPSPEFAVRRDKMVYFIEGFWPELEKLIEKRHATSDDLRAALLVTFPARDDDERFRRLLDNVSILQNCLRARKSLQPRSLAYVIAGAPEQAARYSLDRCAPSREPCKLPIHFRAMREHIQRRHTKWYAYLVAEDPSNVVPSKKTMNLFPSRCSECKRFIKRPEGILAAIRVQPFASGHVLNN